MEPIHALLVVDTRHRERLGALFESAGARSFVLASTCGQARQALLADPSIGLVVTTPRLLDGRWVDLLTQITKTGRRVQFVVFTRLPAGRALRRAIRANACELLPEDCQEAEAKRLVHLAMMKTGRAARPRAARHSAKAA